MKKIRSELDRVVDEANALSMYMMQDPVLQLRFQGDLGVLFFKLMMLSDQLEEPDIEHEIDAMSDTIDAFRRAIMMTAV